MRKFDKVSARQSFSSKHCSAVAEKAMKPPVLMYHEAMNMVYFWYIMVNLAYFWVCLTLPLHIPIQVLPGGVNPINDLQSQGRYFPRQDTNFEPCKARTSGKGLLRREKAIRSDIPFAISPSFSFDSPNMFGPCIQGRSKDS